MWVIKNILFGKTFFNYFEYHLTYELLDLVMPYGVMNIYKHWLR